MKKKKEKKEKQKKNKIRFKGFKLRIPFRKKADESGITPENDSFGVQVYSTEPILCLKDVREQAAWKKDIVLNLSCAALVTTALALFCMSLDMPDLILFVLPCPVIFMIMVTIDSIKPGVIKWLAAGVISVLLLVSVIIWRDALLGGIGTLVNWFYDVAEEAQSYVYDRLPVDEDVSDAACRAGLAWASCLLGMLTALPPVKARRVVSGLIAIAIMLALAYYGLIPSAICIAVMIVALIVALSRGGILSAAPVVLAALLLFGAIILVDPGESYTISGIDENLRDRFAFNSALIESSDPYYDEMEQEEYEDDSEYDEQEEESTLDLGAYGKYALIGIIALVVAVLGAAGFLLFRRISRKRAQNRMGLDSRDAREAVTAMFPYAVRWLKGIGVEQPDASFASMAPGLRWTFSEVYSELFTKMYNIWSEAAYSDHEVSEESRLLMKAFVDDTVDQVNKKCKFRDKLRLKLRYAL